MNMGNLTIPITLVTFVVTFYTQNVWAKYWTAYTLTQHIRGSIFDFTILCSTFLNNKDPVAVWELTRLINLMHYCFYTHVADEDAAQTDFENGKAMHIPIEFEPPSPNASRFLATPEEVSKLDQVSASVRYLIVMKWIMAKIVSEFDSFEGEATLKAFHLEKLQLKLMAFREDIGKVLTQISKPVPLPYLHLVVVITFISTTVYAYAAALLKSNVAFVPLMAYTMGVNGVIEVSRLLAMPFGTDEVDLPAFLYWKSCFTKTFEVLQGHSAVEKECASAANPLGQPAPDENSPLLANAVGQL